MMRSKLMLAGMFTLVLGLFSILPADASAQGWWGNQSQRDRDRWERQQQRERERRERQRARREARRDRRDDRYNDGRYNDGRYNDGRYNDGRYNDGYYGNNGRYGNYDNYPNYGGDYNARQTALNAGYNEGLREGRNDRSRGEGFEYRDESDYRNATKDYSSRYGDRGLYQRYFREAFARGYNDGYRGY